MRIMGINIFDEALKCKKDFDDVNFIFSYIKENGIEELSYRRAVFDIVFTYDIERQEQKEILSHYKYISHNKEIVKVLFEMSKKDFEEYYFSHFISCLTQMEEKEKEKYIELSSKLDGIEGYSKKYINYLKNIMVEDFINPDSILLPNASLVFKDEAQVEMINYLYGLNYTPASYRLSRLVALGEDEEFLNEISYGTQEDEIKATFTKEDYANSVRSIEEVKKAIKK